MAPTVPPVVLVTGAARGVRLALNYRSNAAAAAEMLASLPGAGHVLFPADVSDPAACGALIAAVLQHFGRLDVLVNNAGLYVEHDPKTVGFAEWESSWQRTIATNLTGPAHLAFLAARPMRAQGGGRIVNISSRGAFRGEPSAPAYGAAKAGLNAMGQSLARAFAPEKIYVYTIAPGWVETEMAASVHGPGGAEILAQHPLGRIATPEEVADAAAWLTLDAPAAMTGCILDLNGASYLRT